MSAKRDGQVIGYSEAKTGFLGGARVELFGHEPLSPVVKAGRRMEHLKLDQAQARTARVCWTFTRASGGALIMRSANNKDRFGRHV